MTTLNTTFPISDFYDEFIEKTKLSEKLSIDEFIEYLKKNPTNDRVELINGQIVVMAGGTMGHSALAVRMLQKLENFFERELPQCRAVGSDFYAKVNKYQARSPDFMVVCSGLLSDTYTENPVIIGEVLSKSTSKTDWTEKLAEYKSIPSVREIIFISQTEKKVWINFRSRSIFGWSQKEYTTGLIEFDSVGFSIEVDEIYKRVGLDSI